MKIINLIVYLTIALFCTLVLGQSAEDQEEDLK